MARSGPIKRARRGGFELRLQTSERDILRGLPDQLRTLIEHEDPTSDPAMARLYPPAYQDDPINLMSYVTWVFQTLFGYPREKAERLMMDVHTKGKAVVSNGTREKAEFDVARLHAHGLWATMQKDS